MMILDGIINDCFYRQNTARSGIKKRQPIKAIIRCMA